MRCWLTTHNPHYEDDEAEWCIYVRPKFERKVKAFEEGDEVAIYEIRRGADRVGKGRRPKGRMGVICLAEDAGKPRKAKFKEAYVDGSKSSFSLECPCKNPVFGEVKYADVLRTLKLKTLFGLGGGAGFVEVDCRKFEELKRMFLGG